MSAGSDMLRSEAPENAPETPAPQRVARETETRSSRFHRERGPYARPWRSPRAPSYSGVGGRWYAIRHADVQLHRVPIVLALIALAILGGLAVRDQGESRSRAGDRPRPVKSGAIELSPLQGWARTTSVPRLEGLAFHKPIVLTEHTSGTRLVAGLLPATSPTLLPPEFVRRLRIPPTRPEIAKLGPGTEAYYFAGLILAKDRSLVDLYVVPTTAGVATIACVGSQGIVAPHYDCWRNAATLHVLGGRVLRLGPDAAFRQRLPGALTALDHARQQTRAELATQVPAQQATAASRLGGTFQSQAASLAPLAPASRPWSRALVRELAGAARAYRGVATALRDSNAPGFRKGEDAVHARERRIKQLLNPPADE